MRDPLPGLRVLGPLGRTVHGRWVVAIGLLALLLVVFVVRPGRKLWQGNDYAVYHHAAQVAVEGGDLYADRNAAGRPYIYPPTLAALLAPLTLLPERAAGLIWLAAKLVALLACLRALSRRLAPAAGTSAWSVPLLGLAGIFTIVDNDLNNGQVNLWILVCVVWALEAMARQRPFTSGLAIALGAAIKATPIFLALWLVGRRSLRGLAGLAAGLVLFLLVVPAIVMGPSKALQANADFVDFMVAPYARGASHGEEAPKDVFGYSLRAATHRWLAEPATEGFGEDTGVHVLHLSKPTAEWIYRLLALACVVVLWLATRPPADMTDGWGVAREVALFAATMVIVSPLSLAAHFVVLLPASVYLAARWQRRGDRFAGVALAVGALLINVPFMALPREAKLLITGNGALLLGALVLWAAMARRSRSEPEADAT